MTAYYNENDPFAANWLRNLIKAGHIAPGFVDERSIIDVQPEELHQYTQCHFFAGIGGWSHALRLAGWPDDRAVWTGSPPCQPFSAAGKQRGKDDARHLAPHWLELVQACRPVAVFGEQVAAAIRHGWIDDLQNALEREDYATGAIVLPACSVGAPHLRQRLWFTAQRMVNTDTSRAPAGLPEPAQREEGEPEEHDNGGDRLPRPNAGRPGTGGLANTASKRQRTDEPGRDSREGEQLAGARARGDSLDNGAASRANPDNSFWADADWLGCRDGKWRPVEPGTFPLVNGATTRVGRLRGYGNAIIPQVAAQIIKAMM